MKETIQSENNQKQPTRTLFSIPLNGCLTVIILAAIAGIMVNECKRSQIRLENDRRNFQSDTITAKRDSTLPNTFVLNSLSR
ncbi:MAG: hypothetical protein J5742_01200 [Alphaproteobacteria bacterium]|nr:hypothetical protein [Alphaproteobacteria bacterium]